MICSLVSNWTYVSSNWITTEIIGIIYCESLSAKHLSSSASRGGSYIPDPKMGTNQEIGHDSLDIDGYNIIRPDMAKWVYMIKFVGRIAHSFSI